MPKMDGLQVIDVLKKDSALKNIPVIFISTLSDPADKVLGFQKGGCGLY
jgi:CheY-like chemotaxis protein